MAMVESAGTEKGRPSNVLREKTMKKQWPDGGGFVETGYLIFRQISDKVCTRGSMKPDRGTGTHNRSCFKVCMMQL